MRKMNTCPITGFLKIDAQCFLCGACNDNPDIPVIRPQHRGFFDTEDCHD